MGVGNGVVRTPVSTMDPGFSTSAPYPSGESVYEPTQIQLWNRLPSMGLYPFGGGNSFNPIFDNLWGGLVVGSSEEDREAELFVDLGSKTILFRPFSFRAMTSKGMTGSGPAFGPTYTASWNIGLPVDAAGIFTTGLALGYTVPLEYMPRFGRQDIPYHVSTGPSDTILPGINHLFADQLNLTSQVFNIIGGQDNSTSGTQVTPMLFGTNASDMGTGHGVYGEAANIANSVHPAIIARLNYYPDVISSDFGVGLNGIELPPFHGIARLYGVYEWFDFMGTLSSTVPGGFQADRVTYRTDSPRPTNLIRVNATKQTLFIRQGGGADTMTGDENAATDIHTYMVPETVVDISLIPGYTSSNKFTDYNYVVECEVFGFPEGFINRTNFVVARRHTGSGAAIVDGDNPELLDLPMILPCAVSRNAALYQCYQRTVYQGDPYMTDGGSPPGSSTRPTDYTARYGQIAQSNAIQLATPIQQFDPTTGDMTVTTPNPRALQVLASLDFYTTLGTGKIGGQMWPGTELDCGYTNPGSGSSNGSRIPNSGGDLPWQVFPRAFTENQTNTQFCASIQVVIKDYASIASGDAVRISIPQVNSGNSIPLLEGTHWTASTSNLATAESLAAAINTHYPNYLVAYTYSFGASISGQYGYVIVYALNPGAAGNLNFLSLSIAVTASMQVIPNGGLQQYLPPLVGPVGGTIMGSYFSGGVDVPVNAGDGSSMVSLTGMTERLPLGILVSDSDFLTENILGDGATSLRSFPGAIRAVYNDLPLTRSGEEYTRFINDPGSLLAMSDGSPLIYAPYPSGGGATSFRIYRGGGAVFVLSGNDPGGPVSWVADSFPPSLQPVLKGAVLACKALLVTNYHENALASPSVRTEGDEIQMVILTNAVYGTPTTTADGVTLLGVISPTGYGEGYAAADRYLIPGRPMSRGRSRTTPNPAIQPASYVKPSS